MNTDEDVLQSFEKHQFGVDVESQTTDNDEFYQQINEIETPNKIPDIDQQSIINELTTELNELKQEVTQRKDRLKEITNTDDGK
jgi:cell division protein FtsL